MNKRLIIIGASGHGKVVADIARLNNYSDIVFLDDDYNIRECCGYRVIGKPEMARELDGDLFIAVGDAAARRALMNKNLDFKHNIPVLIHPNAIVALGAEVGEGSVIMAGAVINPGSKIGRGVIVNTCSSVDHDCYVSDFVHIAVGARLCGNVMVGENSWIGAGAVVINNINICADCMIGAGAVVVKDIKNAGTYIGVPAREINVMLRGGGRRRNIIERIFKNFIYAFYTGRFAVIETQGLIVLSFIFIFIIKPVRIFKK